MIEWWNSLEISRQIFALIALPSTLILLLQTLLTLFGVGEDVDDPDFDLGGVDGDVEIDAGLALFSVRGILSMLTIMGWVGFALLATELPEWASVLIAVVSGVLTLIGMAYLMRAVMRLQSSGNINIENCIGKVAQVYIPIPPLSTGSGKVNITVQESYREFSAITTVDDTLKTGAFVRAVAVGEGGVLVVEPVAAPKK
jgi:membrane protein implicated in regulation of membrane protease activity